MHERRTTDYCTNCGESPDSGTHLFGHDYVPPSASAHETQQTVSEWALATFGKPTPLRAALRTNTELAELLVALYLDNKEQIAKELADVMLCLYGVAHVLEIRLGEFTDDYVNTEMPWHGVFDSMANVIHYIQLGLDASARVSVLRFWSTLYQIAHEHGVDLQAEIDRKMTINRARRWKLDGSGCGQHEE